jgi:hypothetical protein
MEALRFKGSRTDDDGKTVQGPVEVTPERGLPVEVLGAALDLLTDLLAAMQTEAINVPPTLPEPLNGTNAVLGVKVSQTGAGTVTIQTADADEIWDVVGWRLSFSAAGTLTIVTDDDDSTKSVVFDIPSAGIDEARIGDYAWFTGGLNEAVTFANSAGNMKGMVYVRKHA